MYNRIIKIYRITGLPILHLYPEQKTFTNYYALFPLQNEQFRPWEVCSLDEPLVLRSLHSLMHFINRCTWKSSQYFIIISMKRHSCVRLKSLCFIKVNVFAYTLYYHHVCILVFLHVFAYSMLLRCVLKFKRLACGSEDVTQYNTNNHVKRMREKLTERGLLDTLLNIQISKK